MDIAFQRIVNRFNRLKCKNSAICTNYRCGQQTKVAHICANIYEDITRFKDRLYQCACTGFKLPCDVNVPSNPFICVDVNVKAMPRFHALPGWRVKRASAKLETVRNKPPSTGLNRRSAE